MPHYLQNFKTVPSSSELAVDLSGFTEIVAEAGKKGELRIIDNGGSWNVGASQTLYSALGEPHFVKVLMSDSQIAFRVVPEGTFGAYEFCKGKIIYSTDLAEKIMELESNIDFPANKTTRCGRIELVQTDEDGSRTVIISFN